MQRSQEMLSELVGNRYGAAAVGACALIGAWSLFKTSLRLMSTFNRDCLRSQYDLMKRYGKEDSWVLVTGGSDGIGFSICQQMAALGFNVCMVGRTLSKMEAKLKEIVDKHPKCKTRTIVFDFGKFCKIDDYKTRIADAVKDIDIAMLFLNAGSVTMGAFKDITDSEVEMMTACNALQPIYTAKVLLDQQLARGKLSAIMITSAAMHCVPMPGCITYACTKTFATFLGQGLNYELKDRVDVLAWCPAGISTKIIENEPESPVVLSREYAVKGALRDLGRESYTYGHHDMFMVGFKTIVPIARSKIFAHFQETHKRHVEEGKSQKKQQ